MHKINVNITDEQYAHLTNLSAKGLSISSSVRYMINEDIHKAKQEQASSSVSKRKESYDYDDAAA